MVSQSKPNPDDRRDNVKKIQDHIDNTVQNIEFAEDMMRATDNEKTKHELKEKNKRREDALDGMREEIRDEAKDRKEEINSLFFPSRHSILKPKGGVFMDISSIVSSSVSANQSRLKQSVDVAVIKKAMDVQEAQAANLIQALKESAPSFGHLLDIKV